MYSFDGEPFFCIRRFNFQQYNNDQHSSYIFESAERKSNSKLDKFIFNSISLTNCSNIICAFWRYAFSNCVYVWLENHNKDTRIGHRCHTQDAHAWTLYIFLHKFDCIYGMDTPPIAHVCFAPTLK